MLKSRDCARTAARKGMLLILAICWINGIVFGVFCYSSSPTEVTSLMHRTLSCSVSIVGLLNAALIPFLLSALFMALSMPVMLFVLCFLKAFLFSFVSMGVLAYAGSGGWLLRYLFLFSDCVTLPVLFGYWFGFRRTLSRSQDRRSIGSRSRIGNRHKGSQRPPLQSWRFRDGSN